MQRENIEYKIEDVNIYQRAGIEKKPSLQDPAKTRKIVIGEKRGIHQVECNAKNGIKQKKQ